MTSQCGTSLLQQYPGARLDNQRRWKWQRARSAMRRNEASDSEFPIRDERPGPSVEPAEEPRRCLPKNRSWVTRGGPFSAHAKEQVKRGGTRATMVRAASETLFCWQTLWLQYDWRNCRYATRVRIPYERTGPEEGGSSNEAASRPREPSGSKWRAPQNHPGCKGCKRRTLPEVEGLLE